MRPTVRAAIEVVRGIAPNAAEIPYQMDAPRSDRMMWKIARYAVGGKNVVGIGTFPQHSTIFFYRGRELDDGSVPLRGTGKDTRFVTLTSPADAGKPPLKRLLRRAFALAAS